jgi:5-methylcytosine-specific restriction endonuclease McrA
MIRPCTTCGTQFVVGKAMSNNGQLPSRCSFCKQTSHAWVLRNCTWCGDLFGSTFRNRKTCSPHCRKQLSKPHGGIRAEARQETKACAYCKAEFRTSISVKIYCALKCAQKGRPWKPEGMKARGARSGYAQRRREAQRLGDQDLTTYTIWKAENGRCRLCRKATIDPTTPRKLKPVKRDAWASLDHIKPLSAGGTHTWANAQLLCYPCNSGKVHTDRDLWGGRSKSC